MLRVKAQLTFLEFTGFAGLEAREPLEVAVIASYHILLMGQFICERIYIYIYIFFAVITLDFCFNLRLFKVLFPIRKLA